MSSLTAPRNRVKPVVSRTLRFNAKTATLTLTIGPDGKMVETAYSLESIGSDLGDCFRLTKHVGHADAECEMYYVHLSDEGHSCDCPGFQRSTPKTGKPCKHVAALAKMRDLDMI